jgi:hypothetical protein
MFCTGFSSHACYISHPYHNWFIQPSSMWWRVQVTKRLIMQFSPTSHFFLFKNWCVPVTPYSFVSCFQNTCLSAADRVPVWFAPSPMCDFVQYANRRLVAGLLLWTVPEEDRRITLKCITEQVGIAVTFQTRFKSQLGHRLSWLRFLVVFLSPYRQTGQDVDDAMHVPSKSFPQPAAWRCTYTAIYWRRRQISHRKWN